MAYVPIAAGEVDEDSPVTEGLMQRIRDNLQFFLDKFHITTGHDHDNDATDGAPVDSFPSAVTATGNVTVAGELTASNFTNYLALYGAY